MVEIPDRSLYGEGILDQPIVDHSLVAHTLLLSLTKTLGIETMDLLPVLRAAREHPSQPLTFAKDSHWNANGHRVVAAALADRIARERKATSSPG